MDTNERTIKHAPATKPGWEKAEALSIMRSAGMQLFDGDPETATICFDRGSYAFLKSVEAAAQTKKTRIENAITANREKTPLEKIAEGIANSKFEQPRNRQFTDLSFKTEVVHETEAPKEELEEEPEAQNPGVIPGDSVSDKISRGLRGIDWSKPTTEH